VKMRPQAGQALVETLAALLLLVPILFALQAIADVQGAAAMATQGARLLALSGFLEGRTVRASSLIEQAPDLLSVDDTRRATSGSLAHSAEPRMAVDATRVVEAALTPVVLISGRNFPLEREGWVTAQAQIPVDTPPILRAVLGPAPLVVASRMTLLTEDFQALGRAEVLQRMNALDAMQPMRRTVRALQPLLALLEALDPPLRRLCVQLPDPDILPADRLSFASLQTVVDCP
jgi:hypothetical protein